MNEFVKGVRVKLAESPAEWTGAVAVRLAVFVDEQHAPSAAELDEHDRSALHAVAVAGVEIETRYQHLLAAARSGAATRAAVYAARYLPLSLSGARSSGKDVGQPAAVVGTGRLLRAAGGMAQVGRLAVLPTWRGRGLGSRLLRLLEEAALARGAQSVSLHAHVRVQPFYARHGYTVDTAHCTFLEDDVAQVRMSKPLSLEM